MTGMTDRENAFEAKFAHDAEMQFKVQARSNKLLGMWAADLLGKTGEDATAYARDVVTSDLVEAGDGDVLHKVTGDLGHRADATLVRAQMTAFLAQAQTDLMSNP